MESGDRLAGIPLAQACPWSTMKKHSSTQEMEEYLGAFPQLTFWKRETKAGLLPLRMHGRVDGCLRNDLAAFASFMRSRESSCSQ